MQPTHQARPRSRGGWQRRLRRLAAGFVRRPSLWRVLRQHGRLLGAVVVGTTATARATTLPAMAIPALSCEFQLAQGQAQWVSTAFMLAMAGTMLATPLLTQRLGLQRCYVWAIGLLLVGAVACNLSSSFQGLLAGRVLQGLATGVMQPMPALVVLRCCGVALRGRVTGVVALLPTLAVALGPGLAGLLMAQWGWRALFWLVWPLGLGAWLLLRGSAQAEPTTTAPGGRLDWPGLLLANLCTVALLNGLVQWRLGHIAVAATLLGLAVVAVVAFFTRQKRLQGQGDRARGAPLVDLSVLQHGRFAQGCVATALYGALLYGSTYLLPLLMQRCLGFDVTQVGYALLVAGLAMVVAMPLAGRQLDRHPHRPVVGIGFAVLALSLAALPWLGPMGWGALAAGAALGRAGLGAALAGTHVSALRGLPPQLNAQGASLSSYLQALGGALGGGLAGLVLDWRLAVHSADQAAALASPSAGTCTAIGDSFSALAALGLVAVALTWRLRNQAVARVPA